MLLALKAQYKVLTGNDFLAPGKQSNTKEKKTIAVKEKPSKQQKTAIKEKKSAEVITE